MDTHHFEHFTDYSWKFGHLNEIADTSWSRYRGKFGIRAGDRLLVSAKRWSKDTSSSNMLGLPMYISWLRMHTTKVSKCWWQWALLGLPQFKDVSTSKAYIDHQILLAISPMTGFETPMTSEHLNASDYLANRRQWRSSFQRFLDWTHGDQCYSSVELRGRGNCKQLQCQ